MKTTSKPSIQVHDVRCEYEHNPLGIDVREPRLSWKLGSLHATDWQARWIELGWNEDPQAFTLAPIFVPLLRSMSRYVRPGST